MVRSSAPDWSGKARALFGALGTLVELVSKVIKLWREIHP